MTEPISSPPRSLSPLATIVVSLCIGGIAGGFVTTGILNYRGLINVNNGQAAATKQTLSVTENSATVDVVKQASPAVVSIVISKDYSKIYGSQESSPFNMFGWPFVQQQVPEGLQEVGGGSGFIVGSDGVIVTNKHVVSDTEASYTVVMNDGKKYDAKVLALDPSNDVAVIKIEATGLPVLKIGDSDAVQVGQTVIAIGNALGEYRNTVTTGIISGLSRTITAGDSAGGSTETLEDVFQTDAAINQGNSGGPLLNLAGQVIAINTAINQSGQLIGFAIPSNVVKRDLDSVNKDGKITRPFLGIRYVAVTKALADANKLPYEYGALIQAGQGTDAVAVVSGSPADKAGLEANDIILEIDGVKIDNTEHTLTGLIGKYNVGDEVTLKVYHKDGTKDVKVTLGEMK